MLILTGLLVHPEAVSMRRGPGAKVTRDSKTDTAKYPANAEVLPHQLHQAMSPPGTSNFTFPSYFLAMRGAAVKVTADHDMSLFAQNAFSSMSVSASGAMEKFMVIARQSRASLGALDRTAVGSTFAAHALGAFLAVGAAELLGSSWLATVFCVLQYGPCAASVGTSLALGVQVMTSTAVGLVSLRMFSRSTLSILAAAAFFALSLLSAWRCRKPVSDQRDAVRWGRTDPNEPLPGTAPLVGSPGWKGCFTAQFAWDASAVFLIVSRAWWWSPTHLTTLALQATKDVPAVCLGTVGALVLMLCSALFSLSASKGNQKRERQLLFLGAMAFIIFAVFFAWQGLRMPHHTVLKAKMLTHGSCVSILC